MKQKETKTMILSKEAQRGFTLVELMIVVALSSMVSYGIVCILGTGASQAQVIGTRMEIQDSAKQGMSRMLQEIRESSPDRIFVNNNSITFQIPQGFGTDGEPVWSNNITYAVGGNIPNQLLRTESNGTSRVIANNIQNITFTANNAANPTLITAGLNVRRQTIKGWTYTETFTGQARVRNG